MSEPHPWQQLTQMIIGSWTSRAINVAAKLRIADYLKDGPLAAGELASAVGVAPGPLYRLLRALASVGVFAQESDGRFRLNSLAELLREGGPESLRALAIMIGEEQDHCWDDLLKTVRTGETAFDRLYGRPYFAYLAEHPEQAKIFDAAMTNFSNRAMRAMLDAYDLSDIRTLADIGGGLGTNLAAPSTATRRCGACCSTGRMSSNALDRFWRPPVSRAAALCRAATSSRRLPATPTPTCSATSCTTGTTPRLA